jgi:hypothetical protein
MESPSAGVLAFPWGLPQREDTGRGDDVSSYLEEVVFEGDKTPAEQNSTTSFAPATESVSRA